MSPFDWQAVVEPSVVWISRDGVFLGSGFLLTPTEVATATHVLQSRDRDVDIHLASGYVVRATVEPTRTESAILRIVGQTDFDDSLTDALATGYVATNSDVMDGDVLKTFAFTKPHEDVLGLPGNVVYRGESRLSGDWSAMRVEGTSIFPGMSGAPVFNLRTGGICGVIIQANKNEGHLRNIREFLPNGADRPGRVTDRWIAALTDEQLLAGAWPHPTRLLVRYVEALRKTTSVHPYSLGKSANKLSPPFERVYVKQYARRHQGVLDADRAASLGSTDDERFDIEAILAGGILLGPPGGGKSSNVRWLVRELCMAFERRVPEFIPIVVRASDISPDRPFLGSVVHAVNRDLFNGEAVVSEALFSHDPGPGVKWHVFVDALDEVLDSERRQRVAAKAKSASPVTVITRELPGEEIDALIGVIGGRVWTLQELSPDAVNTMLRSWLAHLGVENPELTASYILRKLRQEHADSLIRNPLMLTMICLLRAKNSELPVPTSRTELYEQYFAALFDQFHRERVSTAREQALALIARPDAEAALDTVIREIHVSLSTIALRWIAGKGAASTLSLHQLLPGPPLADEDTWNEVLDEIVRMTGVAIPSAGELLFTHQTMADFLAAWGTKRSPANLEMAISALPRDPLTISERQSFIRFAASWMISDPQFLSWVADMIPSGAEVTGALVGVLLDDGIQFGPEISAQAARSLEQAVASWRESDSDGLISRLRWLARIVTASELRTVLEGVLDDDDKPSSAHGWALVTLEAIADGVVPDWLDPTVPSGAQIGLARSSLSARGMLFPLVQGEHTENSSLRRLMPQLFSRAAPTDNFERVVRTFRQHHPQSDLSTIRVAYSTAEGAHAGRLNAGGEPYIAYPVGVAQILAELGFDSSALAAALLRGTVDDAGYSVDQIRSDFTETIAMLVDGVVKLDKLNFSEGTQREAFQKLVLAMTSSDPSVLVIKLAGRLQNARAWGFVSEEIAIHDAKETLEIYAPLARHLGITSIRRELEDLAFSVLHPKVYAEIEGFVHQRTPQREVLVQHVIGSITDDLGAGKISGSVTGWPKPYYSIYLDLTLRGRNIDDLDNLLGIRVIVTSVRDCYAALGAIHARWTPIPGRFKDHIANPKFNLYQALHTTVAGPLGCPMEIRILTTEMFKRAVSTGNHAGDTQDEFDGDMNWSASGQPWRAATGEATESARPLRDEPDVTSVYVFTPRGLVIELPVGATPVDFAYAIHTEVGHRTLGAKVNGLLTPLEAVLKNGDTVEIFTSANPNSGPSEIWLSFAKSAHAKRRIKQRLRLEHLEEAIE